MVKTLAIIVGVPLLNTALAWIVVAVFSDHDPGSVFPWQFVALVVAAVIGLLSLAITVALLGLRWLLL